MTDRPIFAFEDSFLDRLTQSYDMRLDPTSFAPSLSFGGMPGAEKKADREASSSSVKRESSVGSSSGSLWFLNRSSDLRRQSNTTSLRNASLSSCFSFRSPLNSLNSLNSVVTNMTSLGTITSLGSITSESAFIQEILTSPTPFLSRQVTPTDDPELSEVPPPQSFLEITDTFTSIKSRFPHVAHLPSPPPPPPLVVTTAKRAQVDPSSAIAKTPPPSSAPMTTSKERKRAVRSKAPKEAKTVAKAKLVAKANTFKNQPTPSSKRRVRRKEPMVRAYVFKKDFDVLLGRGGASNCHKGNTAYRKYVLDMQPKYKLLDRDDKTALSESVVEWVHNRGGRFLKRERKGLPWYVVTNETARQKVSQAEDHTSEGRALKKARTNNKTPPRKK